ncbi:MAG: AAA family ATPase [Bernardetiaceae bacterium]|nr:AAA family ATPase [Bernardetiaceae bacterium]
MSKQNLKQNVQTIKIPYGVSNFATIPEQGYYFVDKTPFIEKLEYWESKFIVYLRPRKIGKSLFVSLLEHYYGKEHKAKFENLFRNYYIGQNPTPLANGYAVLKMDFSGIETSTEEKAYEGFVAKIQRDCERFAIKYAIPDKDIQRLFEQKTPHGVLETCLNIYKMHSNKLPIYLMIDEYDHFTNEILIGSLQHFKKAVTQNGYVRKFYEAVKVATQQGIVDRVFITGVSPITLDSLTSGFNIITHLTTELEFHDMMGFTETETSHFIDLILHDKSRKEAVMGDVRKWYNGYLFYKDAQNRIYNSDMVLYFGKHFQRYQKYPDEMLDPNIAPDYGKLKAMFEIQDPAGNYAVLERILHAKGIEENLIIQFSFERKFSDSQFVSFLFYMGYLTIEGVNPMTSLLRFTIPNLVIKELYWDYFAWLLTEREALPYTEFNIRERVASMAMGNIESFLDMMNHILQTLSNRDYLNFDEKYIKLVMIGFVSIAGIYLPKSEYETPAGYADLLLIAPPQRTLGFEYLFELKYIKKTDATPAHIKQTQAKAKAQILRYLNSDPFLKEKTNLLAYTLVFAKDKLLVEKV